MSSIPLIRSAPDRNMSLSPMKLERKPERWLCLATSFAMALGISTRDFCMIAGHDGSKIAFPDLPDPLCRRGFHIMEAVFVAIKMSKSVTPVQLLPVIRSTPIPGINGTTDLVALYNHTDLPAGEENNWRFFEQLIATRTGVIECRTSKGSGHAVAFQFDQIFDPDGRTFPYSREDCESRGLFTHCLWIVN